MIAPHLLFDETLSVSILCITKAIESSDFVKMKRISNPTFQCMLLILLCLQVPSFSFGRHLEEQWGYIDKSGKAAFNARFESADDFHEGVALVYKNGRYGYIDKKGEWVIKPQFSEAFSFSDGMARVIIGGKTGFIAAASALTRYPRAQTIEVIKSNKDIFVEKSWLGQSRTLSELDYLLRQTKVIGEVEALFKEFDKDDFFEEDDKASMAKKVLRLRHPVILKFAIRIFAEKRVEHDNGARAMFFNTLTQIASSSKEYSQSWNTFSNLDYLGLDVIDKMLLFPSISPDHPWQKYASDMKAVRKKFQGAIDSK